MTDQPIVLSVPEDVSERARRIAQATAQPVEQVLLDFLQTLPASPLEPGQQAELDALRSLSDDALRTIAREQMPDDAQARAEILLNKNSRGVISDVEHAELEALVERADRLILRKAEAVHLLHERGVSLPQSAFSDNRD
jgi:hypothetical protein